MQYAGAKASTLLFTVLFIFEKFFSTASVSIDCAKRKLEPRLRTGRQCHKLNTVVRTGSGQMLSHQTRLLFY